MSRKPGILSASLLAAIAFVSGILVGSHPLSQSLPEKRDSTQSLSENKTSHPSHRPGKAIRRSGELEAPKIRSLEEIKAALAEIGTRKLAERFNAISELVSSVEPAELPAVLELAENTSPDAFRAKLREELLERWAETQPEAA